MRDYRAIDKKSRIDFSTHFCPYCQSRWYMTHTRKTILKRMKILHVICSSCECEFEVVNRNGIAVERKTAKGMCQSAKMHK